MEKKLSLLFITAMSTAIAAVGAVAISNGNADKFFYCHFLAVIEYNYKKEKDYAYYKRKGPPQDNCENMLYSEHHLFVATCFLFGFVFGCQIICHGLCCCRDCWGLSSIFPTHQI